VVPSYGTAHYGVPPYGYPPPWGPFPPRPPQRPGQLITATVLAFVQALVVLVASVYVWFFAAVVDLAADEAAGVLAPGTADRLATEGSVLAVVQVVSAVLLLAGGIWALNTRSPRAWLLLLAAHALQVVLALYWAVRLIAEAGGFGNEGGLVSAALFFAVLPLVALGLLLAGPGRRWFDGTPKR
jgi:hypothetical protein